MAKVFTIAPGLENMGAMKTGGQGSVYKGRRVGEIITAIKLLPTPIYNESEDDKNYRDFKNEVQKLYKVNEVPNPNVVKIISSGLSETGNFPFIEMDFIEGPDLEELLKPPHDPIFTIKEVVKVVEQLSSALAHCHAAGVRHGDIKSNNVKFNKHTGNYVLLDFGLAVMSDEQRRTSLRHAGAIEFMAPEQNEGQMLFETDVYSFGVIVFELLAGRVPFPLYDKGETARNLIRLSHMETTPPDVVPLRADAMPATWAQEKKEREMRVPEWLLKMMYQCLAKKPEHRFRSGQELHQFVAYNSTHSAAAEGTTSAFALTPDIGKQVREKEQLHQQILQYRQQLAAKEKEIAELNLKLQNDNIEDVAPVRKGVSTSSFIALLLLTIALGAVAAYPYLKNNKKPANQITQNPWPSADSTGSGNEASNLPEQKNDEPSMKQNVPADTVATTTPLTTPAVKPPQKSVQQPDENTDSTANDYIIPTTPSETVTTKSPDQYQVVEKAYFYTSPDESTRRNAYMVQSDNAVLKAVDDQNGFIYVVFTNQNGQTSKGWLRKQDLKLVTDQ